ncbi:MAG: hypothetical protein IPP33_16735 [Flavobacteriales bacterium]|nr:hypothetical protein [Flavobacteriales bacterium]
MIPVMGYMGAAWATLACYAGMAIISYGWGQKHYPVPYNVGRVLTYMAGAVFLWWACEQLPLIGIPGYGVRAAALIIYLAFIWKKERNALRPLTP